MSLRAFKKDEKQIKSWWLECILVETYPSDQIFHWSVPATESPHVIQPNNSVFHTQQNIGFVDGGAEMFKTHFLSNRNSTAMDNDTTRQNKLGRDLAKGHSSFPLYEDTNFGGRQSSATALAMNCPNNYKRQKRELKNRSIGLKKKKKKRLLWCPKRCNPPVTGHLSNHTTKHDGREDKLTTGASGVSSERSRRECNMWSNPLAISFCSI